MASTRDVVLGAFARAASLLTAGRLVILTYHRILRRHDPSIEGCIDAEKFLWHMNVLKESFSPIPLGWAIERLRSGKLPHNAVCVTFDDGYADNLTVAGPILNQLDIPATIFVATEFLDGGIMWNDRVVEAVRSCAPQDLDLDFLDNSEPPLTLGDSSSRREAINYLLGQLKYLDRGARAELANEISVRLGVESRRDLMLSHQQLRRLRESGLSVGAHTISHPILTKVSADRATEEITGSKTLLQELTQESVDYFAYPNGRPGVDFTRIHRDAVENAGFLGAVTTAHGSARQHSDVFQLPRVSPWYPSPMRFWLQILLEYRGVQPVECG